MKCWNVINGIPCCRSSPKLAGHTRFRVHLSFAGYPLCGDELYGRPSPLIGRQALHAHSLSFAHPRTRLAVTLAAPLPADMQAALTKLRQQLNIMIYLLA